MPRYLVERTFPDGLPTPAAPGAYAPIIDCNADGGVTWLHSYVTDGGKTTFCVYDAPTPEAIRRVAIANRLPVDRIREVRVLDPYFYG
ncbi:MAG TPA: DUF4242 domain-containing protein [Gaiellaceae bacterium]|jgi:hypothetical protein|nr:DUF4242 domain-containing protein [Gaiellaceae bacterium]